jgi:alpha/beta superfamily hydrolase
MGENISIEADGLRIEGLLEKGESDRGVVITHPHPLYGGDMYNMIVASLERAYRLKQYTTLRINFRGTGNSQGHFDEGVGEQSDVLAALTHLEQMGMSQLALAGYSFGAWVNALAVSRGASIHQLVLVSPPVGFVDFSGVGALPSLSLVVTGSLDDIAPAGMIRQLLPSWSDTADFVEIDGADHFYSGRVKQLDALLDAHL